MWNGQGARTCCLTRLPWLKDHQKWPNHSLRKLGLYSLAAAQEEEKSLRKAANS